ncbi:TPA: transposase [Escherichia coli]|nr:transposase [Escherichia coli]
MTKYDEQFKLKVAQRYLSGTDGTKWIAACYGLGTSQLKRWVSAYEHHGMAGLTPKRSSYTAVFKLSVLERMWREQWSFE